jgi:acyl-CoA thioesterase-1
MMVTVALAMGWPASGQSQTPEPGGEKPADPAMVDVADVLGLPRVLLIGDSISLGYTLPVRARLAGIANVHRPAANAGPTTVGVKDLDAWLHVGAAAGEPSKAWDVIHVNFGLHDLKIMKPGPDGGVRQVPPAEYEANLRALIGRLRATGASLVWASTTPVPDAPQKPMRLVADVVQYNGIAAQVMHDNGIPIDDLYGVVLPRESEIQIAANVHFTKAGYELLATQVADAITSALAARRAKP